MAEIRPLATAVNAPASAVRGADGSARTVAQRAFFQAAVGRAPGAVDIAAPPAVETARAAPVLAEPLRPPATDTAQPQRFLRPGSMLDIKV